MPPRVNKPIAYHRGIHTTRYDNIAARYYDLRFLADTDADDLAWQSLGLHTCAWSYGCVASMPGWFIQYVTPERPASGPPAATAMTVDTGLHVAFDKMPSLAHASEADAMILPAHPVTRAMAAARGAFDRSFGCFVAGTRIATEQGPVPIENLRAGDLVHTARDGRLRPVVWTGHRTINCLRHPRPSLVCPVRIGASAFGPGLPQRDLLLSPDHAVYWIDVLIPIRCLVNDRSIAQLPATEVTYFHLELHQHDVVLADGLPAETYLDTGAESAFYGQGSAVGLYPDLASRLWDAKACAPLVVSGPPLEGLRRWLAIMPMQQGRTPTPPPELVLPLDAKSA